METLLDDLAWRGLIHQVSDASGLASGFAAGPVTAYIGFDPTADSLHVGSLQQLFMLRRLARAGHRPIGLVGSATGMIGDPSGKSDERQLLDEEVLAANSKAIAAQVAPYAEGGLVVDNAEWLSSAGLLEFLRDVGKAFSVNEMIRKDAVRTRLEGREQGISYTEFSYMLLQAWDFLQLFDRHGCRLQIGGSDQWGNISEGIDLIRRRREERAFGLTSPLLLNADGTKFGKTEAGSVWLSAERTSPYAFFQFWLRTEDSAVGSYLRRFTFLERPTIEGLEALPPAGREAQRVLAREVTTAVHGADEAARAERAASALFTPEVTSLDEVTLAAAIDDAPATPVSHGALEAGLPLLEALVLSGLSASRSSARRDLEGGGVYVNGDRQATDRPLVLGDALWGRWILLRRGRANMHVLSVQG